MKTSSRPRSKRGCTEFRIVVCAAACALLPGLATDGMAATRSWLNAADGDWANSNNWSGAAVPTSADNVLITNEGSFAVSVGAGASFATLLLGGTSGTQTLSWSAGTISGSMTIGSRGVLNLLTAADKTLTGTITNEGAIAWSAGAWYWTSARLDNRPGALVDVRIASTIASSSGSHVFTNAGTLRKSASSGIASLASQIQFINSGLVDIQTGTLQFANGFTSSGTFAIPTNTALELRGGTFTLLPGHSFAGDGYYGIPLGAVTIIGPIDAPRFQLNGGTLSHTGEISGTIYWSFGTLNSGAKIVPGGRLELLSTSDKTLVGALTNEGTITWSAGAWYWSGARLDNRPGALVDVRIASTIFSVSGPHVFTNAGTLRKSVSSGIASLASQIQFINSGLVDIQTGTLQFANGFTSSGTFAIPTNTALELRGGTFTLLPGHSFSGDGYYGIPLGAVTIIGPIDAPRFQLNGGTLSHTGEISGTVFWSFGTLNSGAKIVPGGRLELLGTTDKTLVGALTNEGTIAWTAGPWYWMSARIANGTGGLVTIGTDGAAFSSGGAHTIENEGTFRKSAGSGLSTFSGAAFSFANQGKVEAWRGVLQMPASYSETATASLGVSLGGTNAGSQYGRISFPAGPAFAGRFVVSLQDGFTPATGNTFTVLSYASPTGDLVAVDGLDLGAGLRLEPRFGASDLTLKAAQLPVLDPPEISAYPSIRSLLLVWPIEFAGWKLITETNVLASPWSAIAAAGTNNTVIPLNPPVRFYGLARHD